MKPECPTCQWWNGARCLLTTECKYSPVERQKGVALASETPKRADILDAVKKTICQDRQDVHGNPEDTHALIASFWTNYMAGKCLDFCSDSLSAADVAVMMALFKVARHAVNPNHTDNLHDGIGYLAIAAEIGS